MSSVISQSVDRLKNFQSSEAAERLADVIGRFGDQLAGAARGTERYVRSNPWAAVGAIGLVGIAAGLWLARQARLPSRAADARHPADGSVLAGG